MSVEDRVQDLLEPIVATVGVELVDVEFNGGTLRVTVDRDDGITTESLAEVNRLVSPVLDQHDPIPGRYTLEVSSPGLERPLKTLSHYQRAEGEEIIVKLVPSAEQRRLKGRLLSIDAEGDTTLALEVTEVDGVDLPESERRQVAVVDVASARTVFDWGPAPKPGSGAASSAKSKGPGEGAHAGQRTSQRKSPKNKSAANKSAKNKSATSKSSKPGSSKTGNKSSGEKANGTASSSPNVNREVRDEQ